MREHTYLGAAVTSGMVDDGTLRHLEGRVSVGVCNILTRPRCGRMRSQPGNTLSLTAAAKVKVCRGHYS